MTAKIRLLGLSSVLSNLIYIIQRISNMEEYSHNMNFVGVVGSPHNFSNCLSGQTICCCGSGLVASNVISDQLNNYMPFNSVSQ
jgi:hypothetical protein